jgi:hypothetical protein
VGGYCTEAEWDEETPMNLSHFQDLMMGIAALGIAAMLYSTLGTDFEYTGVSADEFRAAIRSCGHGEIVYRWFHMPEARSMVEMLLVSYLRKHVVGGDTDAAAVNAYCCC